MNRITVNKILQEIDYYNIFKKKVLNNKKQVISYGNRIGEIKINGFLDASRKFNSIIGPDNERLIKNWRSRINLQDGHDITNLIVCLEILEWGGLTRYNTTRVVKLFKANSLTTYLRSIAKILGLSQTASPEDSIGIQWTSGLSKIYSVLHPNIIIYDSRVACYLNYTLDLTNNHSDNFHNLANCLFTFGGNNKRYRTSTNKHYLRKYPEGIDGLNANLVASWIVQLTIKNLQLKTTVKEFENALFMLGFDLEQLSK